MFVYLLKQELEGTVVDSSQLSGEFSNEGEVIMLLLSSDNNNKNYNNQDNDDI